MDVGTISIIGGLVITALGIVCNLIITVINKNSEFKQLRYKTMLECAYKEWEKRTDLLSEISEKRNVAAEFHPFSEYIIYYSEFQKLMDKNKVKKEDFEKFHRDVKFKTELYYKNKK